MWINVKATTGLIVVELIYQHPTTLFIDYECFTTNLYDIFTKLCAHNTAFYAVCDYYIDLMQVNVIHNFRKYRIDILSTTTKCAFDLPTCITDR